MFPGELKAIAIAVIVLALVALIGGACFYHIISLSRAESRAEKAEQAQRQGEERNAELERRVRLAGAEVAAANHAASAAQEEADKWAAAARQAVQDRFKNREAVNHAYKSTKPVIGPSAASSNPCLEIQEASASPALWARVGAFFGLGELRDATSAAAAGDRPRAPGLPSPATP